MAAITFVYLNPVAQHRPRRGGANQIGLRSGAPVKREPRFGRIGG